jgi:hypothetical protein
MKISYQCNPFIVAEQVVNYSNETSRFSSYLRSTEEFHAGPLITAVIEKSGSFAAAFTDTALELYVEGVHESVRRTWRGGWSCLDFLQRTGQP